MPQDHFDPHEGGPAYVYVRLADHLADLIAAGELTGRLPGEREMSETYRVGLATVRRAVGVLRDRGLVVTLKAKGSYVVER